MFLYATLFLYLIKITHSYLVTPVWTFTLSSSLSYYCLVLEQEGSMYALNWRDFELQFSGYVSDTKYNKQSACPVGDPVLILGLGRFPGEGNGYLLRYSCLQNYMDRGAWWASVCVWVCVCVFLKSCIANTKSVLCPRERGATMYMPGRGDNMLTVSSKSFLVKLNWGMMEKWILGQTKAM